MKNLILAIILIFGINISAQEKMEKISVFVRVYDLKGKNISKGKIFAISNTLLELKGKKGPMKIDANRIGKIKPYHSVAHNALIGAALGAPIFALSGAESAESDIQLFRYTAGEGAAIGALLGVVVGAVVGGGSSILFKTLPKYFIINGDELKWNEFKEVITGLSKSN